MRGASVHLLSDYDSLTPLQAAQQVGAVEMVDWLLLQGAQLTPKSPWWRRWLDGLV